MNEFEDIDRRLGAATGDLRTQFDTVDIPDFKPHNNGPRAAVVAMVLLVAGLVAWPMLSTPTDSVDSADNDGVDAAIIDDDGDVDGNDGQADSDLDAEEISDLDEAVDLITGFDTTEAVADREPSELGEVRADPVYGSLVRRVTDAGTEENARVSSSFSTPENADGSSLLVFRDEEFWDVVDRASLESVELDVDRRSEPHWNATDPELIRHFPDSDAVNQMMLLETSLDGSTEVLVDLSERVTDLFPTAVTLTTGLGVDPALGDIYAWAVLDDNGTVVGLVSYDLSTDTVLGSAPAPTGDFIDDFRSVRISPSGEHIIVGYVLNSFVFDGSFEQQRERGVRDREGVLVTMEDGSDALLTVSLDSDQAAGGFIYWEDLDSGEQNLLFDLFDGANTNVTFSASPARPGWAVMSTYGCSSEGSWSCKKLMAVHLSSGTLVNLAHTYSCGQLDLSRPIGSVSPNFDRFYFNSDSGSCDGPVEALELEVPPNMFDLVD